VKYVIIYWSRYGNGKKLVDYLAGKLEKKKAEIGIINTHGMKKNCLHKMEKRLSKNEMVKVAGVDFQVGDGSRTGNGLMENWKVKLDEFAEKL